MAKKRVLFISIPLRLNPLAWPPDDGLAGRAPGPHAKSFISANAKVDAIVIPTIMQDPGSVL
jgi:hypothetical protein